MCPTSVRAASGFSGGLSTIRASSGAGSGSNPPQQLVRGQLRRVWIIRLPPSPERQIEQKRNLHSAGSFFVLSAQSLPHPRPPNPRLFLISLPHPRPPNPRLFPISLPHPRPPKAASVSILSRFCQILRIIDLFDRKHLSIGKLYLPILRVDKH